MNSVKVFVIDQKKKYRYYARPEKITKALTPFRWIDVLREMKERAPDVLNVLVMIAISKPLKLLTYVWQWGFL